MSLRQELRKLAAAETSLLKRTKRESSQMLSAGVCFPLGMQKPALWRTCFQSAALPRSASNCALQRAVSREPGVSGARPR